MGTIQTSQDMAADLTTCIAKGDMQADEILEWGEKYYSGNVNQFILWDLREASLANITTTEVIFCIREVKQKSGLRAKGKTAVLVNNDLNYGIGRMFQAYSLIEGIEFELMSFRDKTVALSWLHS